MRLGVKIFFFFHMSCLHHVSECKHKTPTQMSSQHNAFIFYDALTTRQVNKGSGSENAPCKILTTHVSTVILIAARSTLYSYDVDTVLLNSSSGKTATRHDWHSEKFMKFLKLIKIAYMNSKTNNSVRFTLLARFLLWYRPPASPPLSVLLMWLQITMGYTKKVPSSRFKIQTTLLITWSCSYPTNVLFSGFPWFAPVRTGGVRTGSNRKRHQFPWFDPVPGRICLLPLKYTFYAEYCLPFCRLLLYISKMSPERLWIFVILLINWEISSSGKLHAIFVAKFGGYVVHG